MADYVHHTIVVVGSGPAAVEAAWARAAWHGLNPCPIQKTAYNGFDSFFVPPDGSGCDHERSAHKDEARTRFKEEIRGISSLSWFEAEFGRELGGSRVTDDGCKMTARNRAAHTWAKGSK